MKIIILSVLAVAMIGLMVPNAFAQSDQQIPTILVLDHIPSNVSVGDIITFSGKLLTSDQQYFIPDANICFKDDVSFGIDRKRLSN